MAIEDTILFLLCKDNGLQFRLKNMPIPRVGEKIAIDSKDDGLKGLYKVEDIHYHVEEGEPQERILSTSPLVSFKLPRSDKFSHVVVELSYKNKTE